MSEYINLSASDGHQLEAYVAEPATARCGAVVVVQEIFGVNSHIRSVTDGFAAQGFWAIAPALFDRVRPRVELGYDAADAKRGMQMATEIGIDTAVLDVAASISHAKRLAAGVKVGVVGYCLGGTLAWLAATRHHPDAAVGYYGGRISQYAAETPRCPLMLHFGAKDAHIPSSEIDVIRQAHPDVPVFVYEAGHGFNCDQRQAYEPTSAALARQRTLDFLRKHLCTE
jgi:carboxymethylenebutenolidase